MILYGPVVSGRGGKKKKKKSKFEQKGERVSIMLRTLKRTLEYSLRQVESCPAQVELRRNKGAKVTRDPVTQN